MRGKKRNGGFVGKGKNLLTRSRGMEIFIIGRIVDINPATDGVYNDGLLSVLSAGLINVVCFGKTVRGNLLLLFLLSSLLLSLYF